MIQLWLDRACQPLLLDIWEGVLLSLLVLVHLNARRHFIVLRGIVQLKVLGFVAVLDVGRREVRLLRRGLGEWIDLMRVKKGVAVVPVVAGAVLD